MSKVDFIKRIVTAMAIASFSSACFAHDPEADKIQRQWAENYFQEVLAGNLSGFSQPDGYVPNERAAVKIGEVVIASVFGETTVQNQQPFSAVLVKGYWVISGSSPEDGPGGVANAVISKETGKILSVMHGQ